MKWGYIMSGIKKSLLELVGNTPLVELTNFNKNNNTKGTIVAKLEYFNPLGSCKDRIGLSMIEQAIKDNLITSQTVIIEPTSGNTGVGLAYVCAIKGIKLTLVMPETMSVERMTLLKALGANLILTEGTKGMKGSIDKANELVKENANYLMLQQFENSANVEAHKNTTALEIIRDCDGLVDAFVAGVGTGGTITGVGEVLKERIIGVKIVAVEPKRSAVISGKPVGSHGIQGIGAGFIPQILNKDILDEVIPVDDADAFKTANELAKSDGILVGISSGAALHAALQLAKRDEYAGKRIVVLLADTGERYLSTDLFK